ncbi:hypothetical protein PN36_09620 [Candidatus Thiomargarita nelsonii]|uniref:Uncharacterized protein n=1 Tax=Candidatus Thiomargarita nelsonii TaxID=1003181 RepID=A0A0A6RLK9_9GAMM|nr:hypothetical protein PN36_09620 [Candidatus Thiomargarita nelsonii]
MKIVFYKANEDVWFDTRYAQLALPSEIIFSNRQDKLLIFEQKSIDELGRWIKPLLPRDVSSSDEIFFVPSEIQDKFMGVLNKVISGFKGMVKKGETMDIPTSKELGLEPGKPNSSFYDEMEKQEVYIVEKQEAEKELMKLFNFIANEPNEIDAVILSIFSAGRTRIAYASAPKGERSVRTDTFAMQLKDLITLLDKTQKVYPDAGKLDHVVFQNAASEGSRGSIFHITHLPEYGKYYFLTFISATADGIEMLEHYREQNLDKIKELLGIIYS